MGNLFQNLLYSKKQNLPWYRHKTLYLKQINNIKKSLHAPLSNFVSLFIRWTFWRVLERKPRNYQYRITCKQANFYNTRTYQTVLFEISHSELFYKEGVPENLAKFIGKNFIKIYTPAQVFSCGFMKFLTTTIL